MGLEGKLAAIYIELWTINQKTACLYVSPAEMPNDETAMFMTHLLGRNSVPGDYVAIWVARSPVPTDSLEPDLENATLRELISLAHERGHEASYHAETYVPTTMPEEQRAWDHAERLLRDRGFEEWTAFESAKTASMAEHRRHGTPER